MTSRRLMTVQVVVPPPQKLGAVPHGTRVIAPITSGTFEGPRLRGRVLPGGGDWTLLRSDGVLELDLRITLETDDGALISMTSFGLRHGPPEVLAALARGESVDPSTYYFRTAPRFETSAPQYEFLNRLIAIASGLVFVASSTFQAMGNTVPSLIASVVRIGLVAIPGVILSRLPGFELRWLWWLSVASVFVQLVLAMVLLRREFALRLAWNSP